MANQIIEVFGRELTFGRPASRGWFKSPATLLKGLSFGRPFFIITLGAWIHNHHGGRSGTPRRTGSYLLLHKINDLR